MATTKTTVPPLPVYRRLNGEQVSAEDVRSGACDDETYEFKPLRADPDECDVLAFIGDVPVIHATDLGESIHSPTLRNVSYRMPGDEHVYSASLDAWCSIPRHRSGASLGKRMPHYLVLNVTPETWREIERLKMEYEADQEGEEWTHGK